MSLLSRLLDDSDTPKGPVDPQWRKNARGYYHRLLKLDPDAPELAGQAGVYAIWHRGVRPAWVHIGAAADLAGAIRIAQESDLIAPYEVHGGLFVAWSPIRREFWSGVVNYLNTLLRPVVPEVLAGDATPDEKAEPVPVLPPG